MTAATEQQAFAVGLLVETSRRQIDPADLAARARLTPATVTSIMDGTLAPCPRTQQLLAQALDTTPTRIYQQGGI